MLSVEMERGGFSSTVFTISLNGGKGRIDWEKNIHMIRAFETKNSKKSVECTVHKGGVALVFYQRVLDLKFF